MAEPDNSAPSPKGAIESLFQDLAAIAGAGLIVAGVDLVYQPAGLIAAGAVLLGGAWLSARKA